MFARVGRRTTLMLSPVLLVGCSIVTFLGTTAQSVYLARLLGGAGHGVGVAFASIYVAEVSKGDSLGDSLALLLNRLLD